MPNVPAKQCTPHQRGSLGIAFLVKAPWESNSLMKSSVVGWRFLGGNGVATLSLRIPHDSFQEALKLAPLVTIVT